jgi:signal transduction histidine kinase
LDEVIILQTPLVIAFTQPLGCLPFSLLLRMRISYLIFVGFLLILGMFSATTYINFRQTEQVDENSEFFARSTTIVRQSNRFQRNILNTVSGLRGYLFTGENYFLQSYDSALKENIAIIEELRPLIPDSSEQSRSFAEIMSLNHRWLAEFAQPLIDAKKVSALSDSSQVAFSKMYREKLISGTETNISRRLQKSLRDFSNYEYNLRDFRKKQLTDSIRQTRDISFYLTTFSVFIGLAIAIFLAYRISSRILRMVKMANDIAAGNYHVNATESGRDELSKLAKSLNHMAKVLAENIALLQRKNEEMGQFAHIVSHDLKAPLRGIDNVITWIEEDHAHELTPKVAEFVSLIKGRLIRAENLIQGILLYARIGRELPSKENVDLNVLISEVIESIAPENKLQISVQNDLPVIFAEKIPLQQVLTNLISNAIKYHNKVHGTIGVTFENAANEYTFSVTDNGPGIDKNYHDKIFVIFQTLQERDTFESTGVGLAIVKKILDDRKQSIKLVSALGEGSTFIFTWPK